MNIKNIETRIAKFSLDKFPLEEIFDEIGNLRIRVKQDGEKYYVSVMFNGKGHKFKWDKEKEELIPVDGTEFKGKTIFVLDTEINKIEDWGDVRKILNKGKIEVAGIEFEGEWWGKFFRGRNKDLGVEIELEKKLTYTDIRIRGKTYPIKEKLKQEGFDWSPYKKEWVKAEWLI